MEVSNLRNRILTNQKPEQVVRNCQWNFMVRDDTHKKSMKIVQFSRPPNPPYHLCPKLFHPLTLDVHFQTKLPYLQTITSQLIEDMIHGWLLYFINKETTELFIIFSDYFWHFLEWGNDQDTCDGYDWNHIVSLILFTRHILWHTNNAIVIKDAFTVWCQCQKDFCQ